MHVFLTWSLLYNAFAQTSSPEFKTGQEIRVTVKEVKGHRVTVELTPGVTSVLHEGDLHKPVS